MCFLDQQKLVEVVNVSLVVLFLVLAWVLYQGKTLDAHISTSGIWLVKKSTVWDFSVKSWPSTSIQLALSFTLSSLLPNMQPNR